MNEIKPMKVFASTIASLQNCSYCFLVYLLDGDVDSYEGCNKANEEHDEQQYPWELKVKDKNYSKSNDTYSDLDRVLDEHVEL